MAVDEAARHRLFNRLEAVLGSEEALILMSSLPPSPIEHIATTRDLEVLRHELLAAIANQTRTLVLALVGVTVSVCSVALFR